MGYIFFRFNLPNASSIRMCLSSSRPSTGDPYFIRARDGDDPAVIQVAHDVSDDPELILRDGIFVVAGRLSELFTNAFVSAT